MVLKFSLLSNLFLVSVALAAPPSQLGTRLPPGDNLQLQRSNSSVSSLDITLDHRYTKNWAGAVWQRDRGTFSVVTGTFTIPTVTALQAEGGVCIWVGIDGTTCGNILQVGVVIKVQHGQVWFEAMYEWYPDVAHIFPPFSIKPGDIITITVTAITSTWGVVIVKNRSSGWAISQELLSSVSHALCMEAAEWIVEGYQSGNTYAHLINFGSVTFSNTLATGPPGYSFTPQGADLLDILQENVPLTATSVDARNGKNILLKVKYIK